MKAGADYSYKLKTGLTVSDFAQRYGGSESYSTLCSRDTTISQGKLTPCDPCFDFAHHIKQQKIIQVQ